MTDVTLTQQDTDTELAKMRTDKAASPGELSPRLLLEIKHEISFRCLLFSGTCII